MMDKSGGCDADSSDISSKEVKAECQINISIEHKGAEDEKQSAVAPCVEVRTWKNDISILHVTQIE